MVAIMIAIRMNGDFADGWINPIESKLQKFKNMLSEIDVATISLQSRVSYIGRVP